MNGREDKKNNDLFYTCSLIAYIARRTKNSPAAVVRRLGRENVAKIYELADIYHCDNIDRVTDDFVEAAHIPTGTFDNIAECHYAVPTHWDIGKVYKRLIRRLADENGIDIPDAIAEVYQSDIVRLIEDYNGSFYYENPEYIYQTYRNGCEPL